MSRIILTMTRRLLVGLTCAFAACHSVPAHAEGKNLGFLAPIDECSLYDDAVTGGSTAGTSTTAPPVPEKLLADYMVAIPCLVSALEKLKAEMDSPNFSPVVRAKFLRATGAVRTIMAINNSPEEKLRKVIEEFRKANSPDVASVLSFGARSDDYNTRLNAMLVLSNVVDNTTVCAPIDHLYDAGALDQGTGAAIKGRANLLAVVSVVAPWAYKENYANISNVREFWSKKIPPNDPKFKQTLEILENIRARLDSQKSSGSNRFVPIPEDLQKCKRKFTARWAPSDKFKY